MREILFHGKRTDNGEWVDGFLLKECSYATCSWPLAIEYKTGCFGVNEYAVVEVIPETVGQYTGLTDKNGKKIFERDIVNIRGDQTSEDWKHVNYNALIAFIDGGFCALDGTIEDHGFRRYALARMDFDLEVIGNVHDNPELLEVDDGT